MAQDHARETGSQRRDAAAGQVREMEESHASETSGQSRDAAAGQMKEMEEIHSSTSSGQRRDSAAGQVMGTVGNVCKRCLLRDMAEADYGMIQKYKDAIRAKDRVDDGRYESRLAVCKECDLLNAGTCLACGCYVELRAAGKAGTCPHNKWK